MSDSEIILKPVSALLVDPDGEPASYWIPAYQRGYRWSPLQVTQLLDDVWEFAQTLGERGRDEFYCLQPLVISPDSDGRMEVVDGQQRLTTILLILSYFNRRLAEEFRRPLYKIEFETRSGFDEFLANPTKESAETNVDFFHLFAAINAITEWFRDKGNFVNDVESALLNRTKVIWFQLAEGDKPVEAFTRLNVGKIPLTNDELIRALFLKRSRADETQAQSTQLNIAYEWDLLEKALQGDDFWCFLTNEPGRARNRIGFLFELIAKTEGLSISQNDGYGIFYEFNKKLKMDGATPEIEWRKIKQAYMTIEEWFEDRFLFHVVGFLVNEEFRLEEIRKLSEASTKSAFGDRLRQIIFKKVIGGSSLSDLNPDQTREQIEEALAALEYSRHRKKVRSILLLFNLATLLQDDRSNIRFQFDSFKSEKWDIEHIRSVTPNGPEGHSAQVEWLDNCLRYLRSQNLEKKLQKAIGEFTKLSPEEATDDAFDTLYKRVLEHFKESDSDDADNGIGNLTLLDAKTNRSYKNAVFAVKRQRLLSLDKAGIFVPLCTRNAFLKCYSPQVGNAMFWTKADREGYFDAIVETLTGFFTNQGGRTR